MTRWHSPSRSATACWSCRSGRSTRRRWLQTWARTRARGSGFTPGCFDARRACRDGRAGRRDVAPAREACPRSGGRRVTTAAQRELLRAYQDSGDPAARERLIEEHMPLVRALARRYAGRGRAARGPRPGRGDRPDQGDRPLRPDRGVELTTYAIPTIVGELRRHFRDKSWARPCPAPAQGAEPQALAADEDYRRARPVADGRGAREAAGVEEEEVIDALESAQAYTARSLSAPRDEDELDPLESLGEEDAGLRSGRAPGAARRTASTRSTSASADRPPPFLRGADPVPDRSRGRDLADARLAPHPPRRSRRCGRSSRS